MFQCRTRLCVWCSIHGSMDYDMIIEVSMPHAALCVVQLFMELIVTMSLYNVSMPHAALCVVQPPMR